MSARTYRTFRARGYRCRECGEYREELAWDDDVIECCGKPMTEVSRHSTFGESAAVHGDEIDELVEHGVCHDDGTPRRFRSKTELRRALELKGLTILGETPKVRRWI